MSGDSKFTENDVTLSKFATLKRVLADGLLKKVEKRNRTKTETKQCDHNYSCDSRVLESETVYPKLHGLSKLTVGNRGGDKPS